MYKRQHPITILLGIRVATLLPFIFLVLFKSDGQVKPWYFLSSRSFSHIIHYGNFLSDKMVFQSVLGRK